MPLSPSETRDLIAEECEFPANHEIVFELVGDRQIDSPDGDSVSLKDVLSRSENHQYETVAGLHHMILANLSDDHVGRKHYDDRSRNLHDRDQVSF